jgi:hypothetical protein
MNQPKCYHNYPYQDENPEFFTSIPSEYFDGICRYKCKFCEQKYSFEWGSTEGILFENKWNELNKPNTKIE